MSQTSFPPGKQATNSNTITMNTTGTNLSSQAIVSTQQQNQRYRYQNEIQAMMYTFGDVRQPLSATTLLIEDIVHSQIIELVS